MQLAMNESIGFTVYKTALKLRTEMMRRLKPFGLTPEQWTLLGCLAEQDAITQRELAERTFKDGPTTTRLLDKLVETGLVRRDGSASDRRSFIISITDKGRALRDEILPVAARMNEDAGNNISSDEKALLFSLLNKIQKNIEA
ncbi:MarR family transcriptional regulator [Geobacter sulfurreducens subsp. ethanolicus]|uniref:MarR family transcriptional regulator n=1 Tax=Geomobilimonas luticola TaxID=1114878 RepID=A0ABS5SAV8_9BACT|nr:MULTISPECIES: MarR family transcriptional regulator [Geobacteraceae]MBT0652504.1 MarR family transcriptional regulator [Geomobilimonas luticola]BEH08984.1 MarR family transcriptional regulator [Geobacter sulfurreducens subsp. ethanolicus]